jgi:hypothetical protein
MASTGGSANNDDWVDLTPGSDQPRDHPNLQATANSQVTSVGANAEDRGHSNNWGLRSLVSWIYSTGDTSTSSVDRKDDFVDYVADASSNMAASAPPDPRKGPGSSLLKKAGGAVKKIISKIDDQWEHLDYDKEVRVSLAFVKGIVPRYK